MKKDSKIMLARLLDQELRTELGITAYCNAKANQSAPVPITYSDLIDIALHMFTLGRAWND